jgi:hypothetical protein
VVEEDVRVVSESRVNERFGHAVLHTETAEVYVLDLYARQELVFEGFHMPPLGYASDVLEGDEPRRGLVHVVMSLDGEVVQEASRFLAEGERDVSGSYLQILGERGELFGRIEETTERPGRMVWAGDFGGKAWRAGGRFSFVIEQYGTMELAFLLCLLFIVVFTTRQGERAEADCYRRAAEVCGEGNIRSVNVARRLTGTTLRLETECQFECVEHGSSG